MKRNFIVRVLILAGLILAVLLYWFVIHTNDLEISIAFDEADGIGKDTKIVLQNVDVGEVRRLTTTDSGNIIVDARIYEEYKNKVNSSSAFIIESLDSALESEKKQISLEILKEGASPFPQGAKVEGYSSRAQFFMHASKKILEGAYQQFDGWLGDFQRGLKDLSGDKRLQKLKRDMQELMEEARRSAERGLEGLNKEIPRLKEELNKIIEELNRLGRDREADEFRDEFNSYLKELENRAREGRLNGLSIRLYT